MSEDVLPRVGHAAELRHIGGIPEHAQLQPENKRVTGMVGAACEVVVARTNLRRSRFEILESHQLPLPTFIAGTLILVAIVNVEKLHLQQKKDLF